MKQLNLPESAERLSMWLVEKAIHGFPPLVSAHELAARYRANNAHAHNEARLDALVRWETRKNFTAGFVSGLAGVMTLPIALPSNLGAVWFLQARMAAAMAVLRGHQLDDPWVQSMVLVSLTGGAAPEMLRHAGVRAGEWAAEKIVTRLSDEVLLQINRRVGFRLLGTAAQQGALRVGRLVPIAGAAVGGAIDAYGCYTVAKTARRLFAPPLLLTAGKNADGDAPPQ